MSDEIKEILDNVKKCCDITKDQSFTVYQRQDILAILDYITNLQSKIDKANVWLDKNTDWRNFNCRELKFDENSKPEELLDILKEDK